MGGSAMSHLGRRQFIGVLGGAAAWPLAAWAQRVGRTRPLIGFLGGASFQSARPTIDPWLEAMRNSGYVEGHSVDIAHRFAEGDLARLPELARELAQLKPDLIFAAVTPAAVAARHAAPTTPIVCPLLTAPDQLGLSKTDARPDQNVTGIGSHVDGLAGKLIELALELVPGAGRIGVLVNATGPGANTAEILRGTAGLGASLIPAEVRSIANLERGFRRFSSESVGVVVVPANSLFFAERQRIAKLAVDARMPSVFGIREHVLAGGLAAHGVDFKQNFRRAAVFVDKLLKGARPNELPIEFPTKIDIAVNLKTAKVLGLEIPPTLLARADEVIE